MGAESDISEPPRDYDDSDSNIDIDVNDVDDVDDSKTEADISTIKGSPKPDPDTTIDSTPSAAANSERGSQPGLLPPPPAGEPPHLGDTDAALLGPGPGPRQPRPVGRSVRAPTLARRRVRRREDGSIALVVSPSSSRRAGEGISSSSSISHGYDRKRTQLPAPSTANLPRPTPSSHRPPMSRNPPTRSAASVREPASPSSSAGGSASTDGSEVGELSADLVASQLAKSVLTEAKRAIDAAAISGGSGN